MQPDPAPKSKSLFAVTELTLVASLKEGCIQAQDTRSHLTRATMVMKALNTLRLSSKEVDPTPLIDDVVDGIRAIHSFRLSLLPSPMRPQLLLSVTFDGGWEPYMRQIWRDLGPLLDLIFCNCNDYPLSFDSSFSDYAGWVRQSQVDTSFFYNAGPMTVNDLHYLRRRERQRLNPGPAIANGGTAAQRFQQAMPAIAALYRLSDMYPPTLVPDGQVLLRAAARVLGSSVMGELGAYNGLARTATECAALDWLRQAPASGFVGPKGPVRSPDLAQVQGGVLEPYHDITRGCLLLLQLVDAQAAQSLIEAVAPAIRSAASQLTAGMTPFINLAFTMQGLVLAGLPEGLLQQMPAEFREGMAARAGILGDWQRNHPTRWALPPMNGPLMGAGSGDRVELSTVHAVLHVQATAAAASQPLEPYLDQLAKRLHALGALVLSVQPMERLNPPPPPARGHFGYADGLSQPTLDPAPAGAAYDDQVAAGDLLLGFASTLDDRPSLSGRLWDHSTFLVVRKLRQDVAAFQHAVNGAAAAAQAAPAGVQAILMGRAPDGTTLAHGAQDNNFDYAADPAGLVCPFQSHMRRANPRTPAGTRADQLTVPRLARRGMSYGPALNAQNADVERGLVFMAYNASLAEQFEVIQSWLAGGNSSSRDTWSGQRDPFAGVALDDEPQVFVFEDANGRRWRVPMDPQKPWTTLEWGLYLFVPSLTALREIEAHAREAAKQDGARCSLVQEEQRGRAGEPVQRAAVPGEGGNALRQRQDLRISRLAAVGGQLIRGLKQKEQILGPDAARTEWKLALEDLGARMSGMSQAIWTAVREQFGGVLRTPYGVLVADRQKVMEAFEAQPPQLTASGYMGRMEASFGPIYLGMDDGPAYRAQSNAPNAAILAVGRPAAFERAFTLTTEVLNDWLTGQTEPSIDVKDLSDEVLARLSQDYFGLPDGVNIQAGGWHWEEQQARCPGHFNAPSRYMFQPRPGAAAEHTGQRHGKLLRRQARKFVAAHRLPGAALQAPIGRAILDAFPHDDDLAARTLVGVMMGFLPTVDGNLRATLFEWVSDRRLWDLQARLIAAARGTAPTLAVASAVLFEELTRTMQLRPVPELTWRKAVSRHSIGNVEVQPGDTIVIGIVSASQQDMLRDEGDLNPVFGGLRRSGGPLHACPGYEMAMGVLLGVLASLAWTVRLRPTLNPLTLKIAPR